MASRRNSTVVSYIRCHVLSYQQLLKLNATLISGSLKSRTCSSSTNFPEENHGFSASSCSTFFPRISNPDIPDLGIPSLKLTSKKNRPKYLKLKDRKPVATFFGGLCVWSLGCMLIHLPTSQAEQLIYLNDGKGEHLALSRVAPVPPHPQKNVDVAEDIDTF